MTTSSAPGPDWRRHRGNRVFGKLFADRRAELGLTVEEVAERAGVSPDTVERIESGYLFPYVIRGIERTGNRIRVALDLDPGFNDELEVLACAVPKPARIFVKP